jgi:hypothetical protein
MKRKPKNGQSDQEFLRQEIEEAGETMTLYRFKVLTGWEYPRVNRTWKELLELLDNGFIENSKGQIRRHSKLDLREAVDSINLFMYGSRIVRHQFGVGTIVGRGRHQRIFP